MASAWTAFAAVMPDGLGAHAIKSNAPTFALSTGNATSPQASAPVSKASPVMTVEASRARSDLTARDAVATEPALTDFVCATMALVAMIAHSPIAQMIATVEANALKANANASLDTLASNARSHRVSTVARAMANALTVIVFALKNGRDPLVNDRRAQTIARAKDTA